MLSHSAASAKKKLLTVEDKMQILKNEIQILVKYKVYTETVFLQYQVYANHLLSKSTTSESNHNLQLTQYILVVQNQ